MVKGRIAVLALLGLVLAVLVVAARLPATEPAASPTYAPDLRGCLITERQVLRCEARATEPAFEHRPR